MHRHPARLMGPGSPFLRQGRPALASRAGTWPRVDHLSGHAGIGRRGHSSGRQDGLGSDDPAGDRSPRMARPKDRELAARRPPSGPLLTPGAAREPRRPRRSRVERGVARRPDLPAWRLREHSLHGTEHPRERPLSPAGSTWHGTGPARTGVRRAEHARPPDRSFRRRRARASPGRGRRRSLGAPTVIGPPHATV